MDMLLFLILDCCKKIGGQVSLSDLSRLYCELAGYCHQAIGGIRQQILRPRYCGADIAVQLLERFQRLGAPGGPGGNIHEGVCVYLTEIDALRVQVRNLLVEENIGLMMSFMNRMNRRFNATDCDDLMGVLQPVLLNVVELYNPKMGVPFSSYAYAAFEFATIRYRQALRTRRTTSIDEVRIGREGVELSLAEVLTADCSSETASPEAQDSVRIFLQAMQISLDEALQLLDPDTARASALVRRKAFLSLGDPSRKGTPAQLRHSDQTVSPTHASAALRRRQWWLAQAAG